MTCTQQTAQNLLSTDNQSSLSLFDSKRFLLSDGVHTHAYGLKDTMHEGIWKLLSDLLGRSWG